MADRYASMTALLADTAYTQGVDYQFRFKERNSPYLAAAIHGGGIEPGTTELAEYIADSGGHNFFTFEGLLDSGNFDNLHVTSHHYDAPLARMMHSNAETVVSFHNIASTVNAPRLLMGGDNIPLRNTMWRYLERAGFTCELAPPQFVGTNDGSITNRTLTKQGVQIEMDGFYPVLYGTGSRVNRADWTADFYAFADAINQAFRDHQLRERLGIVNYYPIDGELKNYLDRDILTAERERRKLTSGNLNIVEGIHPMRHASEHPPGVFNCYVHGENDMDLFQAWMDSIGVTPATFGRTSIIELRMDIELYYYTNGTAKQRVTVWDFSNTTNYQTYAVYQRATNSFDTWGAWVQYGIGAVTP